MCVCVKAVYGTGFGVFIVYLFDHCMFGPLGAIFTWYTIEVICTELLYTYRFLFFSKDPWLHVLHILYSCNFCIRPTFCWNIEVERIYFCLVFGEGEDGSVASFLVGYVWSFVA